jgi:flagellin-like protein
MGKMKANRKFKNEEEAVSAVIGVILMVAITVAIAATVYVYVSGMLGTGQQSTPNISFTKASDRITVSRSDAVLDWNDFEITWDTTGPTLYLNGTRALTKGTAIGLDNTYIHAGDYINMTYAVTTVVQIRHMPTNSLIGTWTFAV